MKSLHIRSLDEEALLGLKRRAARHRRSLQKEVEVLLSDAARMVPKEALGESSPLSGLKMVRTGRKKLGWNREELY